VPSELAALDGKRVTITGRDPEKDRLNRADGTIASWSRAQRSPIALEDIDR
jgi:hypothetical protein